MELSLAELLFISRRGISSWRLGIWLERLVGGMLNIAFSDMATALFGDFWAVVGRQTFGSKGALQLGSKC